MICKQKIKKEEIKILFVDDEELVREVAQAALEARKYQVTTANNGRDALMLFRSHTQAFDLLITDFNMPFMNGKELIQQLAFIRTDLPIILSTADSQVTDEEFQAWGVTALLRKPYSLEELESLVQQVLDHGTNLKINSNTVPIFGRL